MYYTKKDCLASGRSRKREHPHNATRVDCPPGQKFSDADLMGIPVRLVVSAKTGDKIEWKKRNETDTKLLSLEEVIKNLK